MYAKVIKRLGGRFLQVILEDNTEALAKIRGKLYKRGWMNPGDIILVGLRPSDINVKKKKVDVIHLYKKDEISNLIVYKELDNKFVLGKDTSNKEDCFTFTNDSQETFDFNSI